MFSFVSCVKKFNSIKKRNVTTPLDEECFSDGLTKSKKKVTLILWENLKRDLAVRKLDRNGTLYHSSGSDYDFWIVGTYLISLDCVGPEKIGGI